MKPTTKEVKKESTNNQITETPVFKGKTEEEIREMVQNLETQLTQQQQTLQTSQTMVLKIQVALELALQMLPQETENQ